MGGQAGVAGAHMVVAGSPWRNAVAPLTARPTRPMAQPRPRRQPAPCSTRAAAVWNQTVQLQ